MTSNEMNLMIAELAAKCNVSHEEAKAALEAGDWNRLTAAQMLEDGKLRRLQELEEVASSCETADAPTATDAPADATGDVGAEAHGKRPENLGGFIRRLAAWGLRNRFEVRRGDQAIVTLPVIALALFMLCAFWPCVLLLAVGLFAGCRYRFNGKELGRECVNGVLDRAADAAERVKKRVARA